MTKVEAAKYRWEFMRRNKSYQADYRDYKDVGEMARKWPLLFGKVQDPKLSFEEIYITPGKIARQCKIVKEQQRWLETSYRVAQVCSPRRTPQGVLVDVDDPINDEITSDDLLILVKLSRVNSIARTKEAVCKLLDADSLGDLTPVSSVELPPNASLEEHKELQDTWFQDRPLEDNQIYDVDFKTILRIGDMIDQDKMTFDEAARKAYPRKYRDTKDEAGDPEAAVRAVRKMHVRYRYFIEKGFLKITTT